ncbi:MAG: hypothetical protein JSR76_05000 [Verrucomicrobia bacterium]|nr:hypothetical protein [Verrucomicrobiota bacterium]
MASIPTTPLPRSERTSLPHIPVSRQRRAPGNCITSLVTKLFTPDTPPPPPLRSLSTRSVQVEAATLDPFTTALDLWRIEGGITPEESKERATVMQTMLLLHHEIDGHTSLSLPETLTQIPPGIETLHRLTTIYLTRNSTRLSGLFPALAQLPGLVELYCGIYKSPSYHVKHKQRTSTSSIIKTLYPLRDYIRGRACTKEVCERVQSQESKILYDKLDSPPDLSQIGSLTHLTKVTLLGSSPMVLPDSLQNCKKLTSLKVEFLESFPDWLNKFPSLRELALPHSHPTATLPPDFFIPLKRLSMLHLFLHRGTLLPPSLSSCRQLTHLSLEGIEVVPEWLSRIPLEHLSLSMGAEAKPLPPDFFAKTPHLGTLHIKTEGPLQRLPPSMVDLPPDCIVVLKPKTLPRKEEIALRVACHEQKRTPIDTTEYRDPLPKDIDIITMHDIAFREAVSVDRPAILVGERASLAERAALFYPETPFSKDLKHFLFEVLHETSDAKTPSLKRECVLRVEKLLNNLIAYPLFRREVSRMLTLDGSERTYRYGEDTAILLDNIECAARLYARQTPMPLKELAPFLIALHRLERLDIWAGLYTHDPKDPREALDPAILQLFARLVLKGTLSLPIQTKTSFYSKLIPYHFPIDLVEAEGKRILEETSEIADQVAILVASPVWQERLRETVPSLVTSFDLLDVRPLEVLTKGFLSSIPK